MPDLASIADGLYALPAEEFTAARDAAAKDVRADDAELAKQVKALKRPSASAWLVNQLARQRADRLEELLALGDDLRAAQEALAGDDGRPIDRVCPTGVRIFADALATVARTNGIDPETRSWRHGSIASRIAFLQKLAAAPEREAAFQRDVRRVRYGLAAGLLAVIGLAGAAHWMGMIR